MGIYHLVINLFDFCINYHFVGLIIDHFWYKKNAYKKCHKINIKFNLKNLFFNIIKEIIKIKLLIKFRFDPDKGIEIIKENRNKNKIIFTKLVSSLLL